MQLAAMRQRTQVEGSLQKPRFHWRRVLAWGLPRSVMPTANRRASNTWSESCQLKRPGLPGQEEDKVGRLEENWIQATLA